MTYSKTHKQKKPDPRGSGSPLTLKYSPDDMGTDDALSPAAYRDHLSHLHNRLAVLSMSDPVDEFYKLSSAIGTTKKSFNENAAVNKAKKEKEEAEAKTGKHAFAGPISDAEFDNDIKALCDLLNELPDCAYQKEPTKAEQVSLTAMMTAQGVPMPPIVTSNPSTADDS
ncbi:MAG: hypothetical protein ACSHXY_10490 [Alphaproteobacteria bacterium]